MSIKNKVLFFVTDNYPFGYGETFIENEIDYLSQSFKKIYIISKNINDKRTREVPKNCEVFRIEKEYKKLLSIILDKIYLVDFISNFNLKNLKKLIGFQFFSKLIESKVLEIIKLKELKKEEIMFYSYWFYNGSYAGINLKRKKIINKVISRAHGYDIFFERGYQPLKKEILSELERLFPACRSSEKYLKEKYPNYQKKINYMYLGTVNKENLKLKDKKKIINLISCSSTIPLKRVKLIVEGLSYLSKDLIEKYKINWIHIGDGIEQENIKKLAKDKLKNISFNFIGKVYNKEVLKFYKHNDIYLFLHMSSTEGGTPVSMMEAQSFGIPIIASNVGGVSEIVNEKTGILLSINPKIEEITEAIEKMINLSKKEYKEYQKNSYKNWKKKFNAKKNYLKFIKEIKNM